MKRWKIGALLVGLGLGTVAFQSGQIQLPQVGGPVIARADETPITASGTIGTACHFSIKDGVLTLGGGTMPNWSGSNDNVVADHGVLLTALTAEINKNVDEKTSAMIQRIRR